MAKQTQDDARERELKELFELEGDFSRGSPHDALLMISGVEIPFQLKSATTKQGSVSTGRDVGPNHIRKWRELHWLFGFYTSGKLTHCIYAPPEQMAVWLDELEAYIAPDVKLADLAGRAIRTIADEALRIIVGLRAQYTIEDVCRVAKRMLTAKEYKELGSSIPADKMLEVLAQRIKYIANRGATLNNPHIPARFFESLPRIVPKPKAAAAELRQHVEQWRAGRYQVVAPAAKNSRSGRRRSSFE